MKTLTITEIVKNPALLRGALEIGIVKIVWKEQKPNGEVVFSAIAKREGEKNVR